jgi:hypothetical protein
MILSEGSWLCHSCDFAPGDPEYLERPTNHAVTANVSVPVTAPTLRSERPSNKPPAQVLGECISTLGAFARALDATKRVDMAKFLDIRKDVDAVTEKVERWTKEVT